MRYGHSYVGPVPNETRFDRHLIGTSACGYRSFTFIWDVTTVICGKIPIM